MVKRTEIHIPVSELTRVSFSCDDCGAVITIDIAEGRQRAGIGEKIYEKRCPACNCRPIRPVFEALIALMAFHEKATAEGMGKTAFHLVVSEPDEE